MGAMNRFDNEKVALDEIINDLKLIIGRDEITGKEIEEILSEVKSEEIKKYLKSLEGGSKPEDALKDAFFAGVNSPLVKYLFGWINPETNVESGFVDYLTDSRGDSKGIAIEIKLLFEAKFESGKSGRVLEKITQRKLRWDKYKDQIRKYLGRRGEFVIFTNLKEWYFFSRSYSLDEECKYFFNTDFEAFIEEYSPIEDLSEYLDRKEQEAIKEVLDKKFFASLRSWINELSEAEFLPGISEREKNELIINLINKFIFIQTLDDFWVIENHWIQNHWDSVERKWQAKGKLKVLEEFFNEEVNKWFYEFYDTELFRGNILDYVERDERNIDLFFRKLKLVLGIDFGATAIGWVRGIMQYNFRRINEDIFGKAYESYLAELRKEQGIFYTPSYITEYIAENTVGRIFDDILGEIEGELTIENFKEAKKLVEKFTSVKVLDPACGSGSFPIKTLRLIWKKYARLREILGERERVYLKNGISSDELDELNEIKRILGVGKNKDRELISKVILRHIHGNDLDRRALEVAKVNIWLEAIKLAPKDFRFDLLGETNHILPNLEMNLTCGDSLVGLSEDLTIEVLKGHKEKIVKLWELREKYLEDTSRVELVNSIERVKNELRGVLYNEFKGYLEENNLPLEILEETKPLHWALEFWYVFFDEDGEALPEEERGFDAVVGNPPWIQSKFMLQHQKSWYNFKYSSMKKQYDIFNGFVEQGINNLKNERLLSFILPNRFVMNPDYKPFRYFLLSKTAILEIVDIGDEVFKDSNMPSLVLSVKKEFSAEKRRNSQISVKLTDVDSLKKGLIAACYPKVQTEFFKKSDYLFTIYKSEYEGSILEKIESQSVKTLAEFVDNARGVEIGKKSKIICNAPESNCVPFLTGEVMGRYVILEHKCRYIRLNVPDIDYKSPSVYAPPKIIIRKTGTGINATIDYGGYYVIQVIYILKRKDTSELNLEYLLGILNSNLMQFYYFEKFGEKSKKTFPHLRQTHILNLPIKLLQTKKEKQVNKEIENLVKNIIILKKAYYNFLKIWNEWSIKLKNDELSLHQILVNDANLMRTGEFEKTWTSEATFYPDEEHKNLSKGFKKFRIIDDNEKPILKVYGLDENNKEETIYELEFKNRELMLHVFLSIKQALESKRKKTLAHLLAKTIIPLIHPDSEKNTPNIMWKVREDFGGWVESEKIEHLELDIVKIENEIEDVDANIDALVFRLYGLNENEVRTVLESLNVIDSYQHKVLGILGGLP